MQETVSIFLKTTGFLFWVAALVGITLFIAFSCVIICARWHDTQEYQKHMKENEAHKKHG